jgi:hypothetical protein
MPTKLFHVTRAANRSSIRDHGLDWRRMKHPGIANSDVPESEGVFLARDRDEAAWFVRMGGRSGEAIDVWEVTLDLEFDVWAPPEGVPVYESLEGFLCHREPIPPDNLRLLP